MAHAFNPSALKAEAGGSQCEASLVYGACAKPGSTLAQKKMK